MPNFGGPSTDCHQTLPRVRKWEYIHIYEKLGQKFWVLPWNLGFQNMKIRTPFWTTPPLELTANTSKWNRVLSNCFEIYRHSARWRFIPVYLGALAKVIDRSFDLPYINLFSSCNFGPRPIATKLSHTLESECNLRNWVRNSGPSVVKIWGQKCENSGPGFGQLPDLTANNFGMKQHVVNRKIWVENYRHSARRWM